MKPIPLDITITVTGPVLVHSSASSAFGLDAAVIRMPAGPQKNKPYLPFSLIKGKVLDGWRELRASDATFTEKEEVRLFGKGERRDFSNAGADISAGVFLPGDLISVTPEKTPEPDDSWSPTRPATAVDDTFGGAKAGSLRVTETPYRAGESVTFEGWGFLVVPENEAPGLIAKLNQALAWTAQVGAFRTTGFGEVTAAGIAPAGGVEAGLADELLTAECLEVRLSPHVPLCIGRHHVGDNLFPTDTVIPGNMIAGAVAQTIKMLKASLPDGFDDVRFFHARPVLADEPWGTRPEVPPLSLGATSAGLVDLVDQRDPVLLKDEHGHWTAPAFSTDWKGADWDKLGNGYPWVHPVQETRVRTKIDPDKRTAHKGTGNRDGQLFALDVVHPFDSHDRAIAWTTRIDFGLVDARGRGGVVKAVAHALQRLAFVGKTKAVCRGDVRAVPPPKERDVQVGQTLRLTLQAPALLVDPRFQNIQNVPKDGPIDPEGMHALYKAAWDDVFGVGAVDYSHGFADQAMVGGDILAYVFQKNRAYNPWIHTKAGSVFVFTVKDADKVKKKLNHWLRYGVDLPVWAKSTWGSTWKHHPFLPQNGFGEVAVHSFRFPAVDVLKTDGTTIPLPRTAP